MTSEQLLKEIEEEVELIRNCKANYATPEDYAKYFEEKDALLKNYMKYGHLMGSENIEEMVRSSFGEKHLMDTNERIKEVITERHEKLREVLHEHKKNNPPPPVKD